MKKVYEIHKRYAAWSDPLFKILEDHEHFTEVDTEGYGRNLTRVFEIHRKRRTIKVNLQGIILMTKDVKDKKPTIVYRGYTISDKLLTNFLKLEL